MPSTTRLGLHGAPSANYHSVNAGSGGASGLPSEVDDAESSSQCEQLTLAAGIDLSVSNAESSAQCDQVTLSSGSALSVDSAESSSEASPADVIAVTTLLVGNAESSSEAFLVDLTSESPLFVDSAESSSEAQSLVITEGTESGFELNGDPLRIGDNDGSVLKELAVIEFSVLDVSTVDPVYLKFDVMFVYGLQTGRIRRWVSDFPLTRSALQSGQGDSDSRITFQVTGGRKTLDITDMVIDAKLASTGSLYIEFEASETNDSKFYEISNSNSSRPSLSYTEGATLDVASCESQTEAEEAGPVILSAGLGVTGSESRSETKRLNIPFYGDTVGVSVWGNIEPVVIYPARALVRPITHE